jgi:hypothetical protein
MVDFLSATISPLYYPAVAKDGSYLLALALLAML